MPAAPSSPAPAAGSGVRARGGAPLRAAVHGRDSGAGASMTCAEQRPRKSAGPERNGGAGRPRAWRCGHNSGGRAGQRGTGVMVAYAGHGARRCERDGGSGQPW
jgi:hypothetical protein